MSFSSFVFLSLSFADCGVRRKVWVATTSSDPFEDAFPPTLKETPEDLFACAKDSFETLVLRVAKLACEDVNFEMMHTQVMKGGEVEGDENAAPAEHVKTNSLPKTTEHY